ncbi:MAG: Ig domain-containing protein [Acidobacteriota bacterium]
MKKTAAGSNVAIGILLLASAARAQFAPGPGSPSAREGHGMVYDSARARVVVFGGDCASPGGSPWELDGTSWGAGPGAPGALAGRTELAMAYDAGRGRTVVFGGASGATLFSDTWEYDGTGWIAGPSAPAGLTPRTRSAMAYDSERLRMVLFGGEEGAGQYQNDTWEYDGSSWISGGSAAVGQPARFGHALAYSTAMGGLVLFGGASNTAMLADSWSYESLTVAPATLPIAILGQPYSAAFSASGGVLPYAFAVTSGTLPPGLVVDGAGALTGTPASAGTFAFLVKATDASGAAGSVAVTLTVTAAEDFLVGRGLGQPNDNRVRLHDATGAATPVDFLAYSAGKWGCNVASGNVDADPYDEILTGPGPGDVFGPQVRGFRRDGTTVAKINFYAYGTLKFGVNAGGANLDGDPYAEVLTGPGPGTVFGPHVRGFGYDGSAVAAIGRISFFAYSTLRFGVNVAGGSVDTDPFAEILTAPGPGIVFGAQIRGWNFDASVVTAIGAVNFVPFATPQYGASVAAGDVDLDAIAEIVVTPGPGPTGMFPSRFLGFDYDAILMSPLPGYDVTPFTTFYGGRVGLGDLTVDARDELLAGAGRDPAADSTVVAMTYDGAAVAPIVSFAPFAPGFGVNPTTAAAGY